MSHGQANKLLLLAAFLWGAGNVAQQTILENMGPFFAVGLRCIIGALVILPFTLGRKFNPKSFGVVANRSGLCAILSFGAAVVCQQIGFGHTTVTNAGFIINTTAVITPLIAWMLSLHRPEARIWPAAALTLLGAAFMTNGSIGGFNIGDLYCLASAVFFSLWMIYLGEFVKRDGNAAQLTLAQFFLSGAICLAVGTAFETITLNNLRNALPELMLLGILSTGAAYLLQSIAQKNTSAGEAAVITSGEAVFGAIGAFLLIGERLTLSGGTGAALVFCGILILQLPPRAMAERWDKYIIRRRAPDSKARDFQIDFAERASPTPAVPDQHNRKENQMRNYAEFKGYRSRIEFDGDSGSFVPRRVSEEEPGTPEKLFLVADSKRDDIRQTTDDPILQRRRARA